MPGRFGAVDTWWRPDMVRVVLWLLTLTEHHCHYLGLHPNGIPCTKKQSEKFEHITRDVSEAIFVSPYH